MNIIRINESDADRLSPLVAEFRVTLRSYKNIVSQPDIKAAKEEILDFLASGYPLFAAEEDENLLGYIACRIEEPCLWVEHIFVHREFRRKGVASELFRQAEKLAGEMGEETVFNFVHPNNEDMIRFLRSKGYTVLNMIEIRKPYRDEKPVSTIRVGSNDFDY